MDTSSIEASNTKINTPSKPKQAVSSHDTKRNIEVRSKPEIISNVQHISVNDGIYEFSFCKYDTVFDIDESGATQGREGAGIIHNYRDGKDNQKWFIKRDKSAKGEQYYTIMNMKSKLFLTAQSTFCYQYQRNNAWDNQLFAFSKTSDGKLKIKVKSTGYYLTSNDGIWKIYQHTLMNNWPNFDQYIRINPVQAIQPQIRITPQDWLCRQCNFGNDGTTTRRVKCNSKKESDKGQIIPTSSMGIDAGFYSPHNSQTTAFPESTLGVPQNANSRRIRSKSTPVQQPVDDGKWSCPKCTFLFSFYRVKGEQYYTIMNMK